ncbi:IclR family transcriptional regulator [Angustibacter sp. McL0619]|uniref:IclR family transcriptional regulator n=1 Tax=Angustibacter sp. McL0619 TaxID=3415676 RepID=UPI003CE6D392
MSARVPAPGTDSPAGLELIFKVDGVITLLERHGEMTAAELAEALGEPLSSTYRMLQSLTGVGWIDRSPRRGYYRLGLPMMTIGSFVEDSLDIREVARPSLQLLLRETSSTSFLCVRRGSRAVCVDRLEGRAVRSLAMQLGSSLPMYAGAAPLALLAFLPEPEQELVLRQGSELPGDPHRPAAGKLERILADVRRNGYAVSDGDVTTGIAALGAPVFNHRHELVASISISGLRAQILGSKLRRNSAMLIQAASAVSVALGDEAS